MTPEQAEKEFGNHIRVVIREELDKFYDGNAEHHRMDHETYVNEVLPFMRIFAEKYKRQQAMIQRLKEHVLLWTVIAGLTYVAASLWSHTIGKIK